MIRLIRSIPAAVAVVLLLPAGAHAADWFVSTAGNDLNAGTSTGAPFRTIQKGLNTMAAGDRVVIAPGNYAEAPTRTFTTAGTYTFKGDATGAIFGVAPGAVNITGIGLHLFGTTGIGIDIAVEDLTATAAGSGGGFGFGSVGKKLQSVTLTRCSVTGNSSNAAAYYLSDITGSVSLTDCIVGAAFGGNNGIQFLRCNNVTLLRCQVLKVNGNAAGVKASTTTGFLTIESCTIRNTDNRLIWVQTAPNLTVKNCTLSTCLDGDGLYLDGINGGLIENNVVDKVPGDALHLLSSNGATQEVLIQRNIFRTRSPTRTGRSDNGIQIQSSSGGGTKRVTIKNNLFYNLGGHGIVLYRSSGLVDRVAILNNTFFQFATPVGGEVSPTGHGIHIPSDGNLQNIVARYNIFVDGGRRVGGGAATTGASYGINIGALAAPNVSHSHNLFCNNKSGAINGGALGVGETNPAASTVVFIGGNAGAFSTGQACDLFNNPTHGDAREFRLPQTASGQPTTSPAVDAGDIASSVKDPADVARNGVASVDLSTRTTRMDNVVDAGNLDFGYHFHVPVALAEAYNVSEDSSLDVAAPGVLGNDTDELGHALSAVLVGTTANGALTLNADGSFSYTPNAGFSGADSFTYRASDGAAVSNLATVTLTVDPVNDAPSFTKGPNQTFLEDAGGVGVLGWATAISPGPASEAAQTVDFVIDSNTNPGLFSTPPAVDASGNLTFATAANANGSADITLHIHDDGGTANGGVDASAGQTFTINVTAVNDAPSFTKGEDQTVLEDAGAQSVPGWATALSPGPADEAGQLLDFVVDTNTNPALFSAGPAVSPAGALTFTPAANANGSADVTLHVHDNGGTANGGVDASAGQTFTINVTAVNDAPSFTKGPDQTVNAGAGAQTAAGWATAISRGPANESGQAVDFPISNDNNPLFTAQPAVAPNGDLTYTPVAKSANLSGIANVTVRIHDDGGTANSGVDASADQTFTISVNIVNTPPAANDQAVSTNENTGVGITLTGSDADTDPFTFQIFSNPANGALSGFNAATGAVTYTPTAGFSGTDTFQFRTKDSNEFSSPGTVTVTVNKTSAILPTAVATRSPSKIFDGQVVTFGGSTSSDPDGTIVKWEWDFGDGSAVFDATATSGDTSHAYATPGTFNARLTVTDDGTNTNSATVVVTVVYRYSVGVVRSARFLLDESRNGLWSGAPPDWTFVFGNPTDTPLIGDWNGNGKKKVGTFQGGTWILDVNNNGVWNGPGVDRLYTFGQAGDKPVVGDWDGDGDDEIGVVRNARWYLDMNGNGVYDGPVVDRTFVFGLATDTPIAGDWDGDGKDEVGLFGRAHWFLDINGNFAWNTGIDASVVFGLSSDKPIVGDWDGNGPDNLGVYRNGNIYLDLNGNRVWNNGIDKKFPYGIAGDLPAIRVP